MRRSVASNGDERTEEKEGRNKNGSKDREKKKERKKMLREMRQFFLVALSIPH